MKQLCGTLLLAITCSAAAQTAGPCSVCPDPNDSITTPDKVVTLPGYDPTTCSALSVLIPLLLTDDDPDCQLAHSVSSICGCPYREDACHLCPNGGNQTANTLEINYSNGTIPTCELLEAFLRSTAAESPTCQEGQIFAEECGCPINHENQTIMITSDDEPINSTFVSPTISPTMGDATRENTQCSICWDDSPVPRPEADVRLLFETLIRDYREGTIAFDDGDGLIGESFVESFELLEGPITCQFAELLVGRFFRNDDEFCTDAQYYFGGLCGCPPINNNGCIFCPNDDEIPLPDKKAQFVQDLLVDFPTCQQFADMLTQADKSSDECWQGKALNFDCGCNEGQRDYFGTGSSDVKKAALAGIPRATGFLSILASSAILWNILRDPKKRRGSMFHGLMIAMSVFDIITSIGWMLSSTTANTYFPQYNVNSGVYGARGNDVACEVHGFFMELGYIGSTSYNLALTVYYLNVITKNKRDHQLNKRRAFFHVPALLFAFTLAFAGIPYYQSVNITCQVAPPPSGNTWIPTILFSLIPVLGAMLLSSLNMVVIYLHVRKLNRAARRWRMNSTGRTNGATQNVPTNQRSSRFGAAASWSALTSFRQQRRSSVGEEGERRVFWQAVFYMLAFVVTWTPYIVSQFYSKSESFSFWLTVVICSPLQGVFNSMVYFRPQYISYLSKKRRERQQAQRQAQREAKRRPSILAFMRRAIKERLASGTSTNTNESKEEIERIEEASSDLLLDTDTLPQTKGGNSTDK